MSHHAQLSPEAIQQLKAQKRNSTILAIIIALLVSALIVVILFFIALSSIFKNEEQLISYSPGSEVLDEITEPQTTSEVKKKPSAPSSSISKVIAANTPSPTAIPVPKDTAVEPSLDFGSGSDFGDGWGGSGFGDGSAGAGKSTPFGKTGGAGLKGAFYDLKQTRKRGESTLAKAYKEAERSSGKIAAFEKQFAKLHRARYSAAALKNIYKADVELSFTNLAIANANARIAPEAFSVEKEVKPSAWIIVYEGRIDDYSGKLEEDDAIPGPSLVAKGMIKGDKFIPMSKGDEIRIVVGEVPGGFVGGGLFVAEEGVKYKKNKAGQDILPPFTTLPLTSEDIKRLKNTKYPMELDNVPVFPIQ